MGVLPYRRKKPGDDDGLCSLLALAQEGNQRARAQIIEQYAPFVLRIASQASHRYIDRSRDDEYSVGLLALNEAIDRFDPERNVNFLVFAETIIRRRLIDYYRSQQSQVRQVPWTEFEVADDEDNVVNVVEVQASVDLHERAEEQERRRQEIEEYERALSEFGLTFAELVELSPKHADARRNAMEVAKMVAEDEELRRYVQEKKALPLKQLERRAGVSRKTMERQRKYILAIVVLLCGDFEHLRSYIL
ncbi:MAG: RNA polymerase sigma factor SigI [Alicyclobacillaceae bacterium]|nr:RNA polymerase sigma factor SigI [Alicyclobacillaceae bacterium]